MTAMVEERPGFEPLTQLHRQPGHLGRIPCRLVSMIQEADTGPGSCWRPAFSSAQAVGTVRLTSLDRHRGQAIQGPEIGRIGLEQTCQRGACSASDRHAERPARRSPERPEPGSISHPGCERRPRGPAAI